MKAKVNNVLARLYNNNNVANVNGGAHILIGPANRTTTIDPHIEHAWELMDEYYKLTDQSRAYVVAIVLDPRQKYQYFYRQWDKSFHQGMKDKMESMFREFEASNDAVTSSENSQSSTSSPKPTRKFMMPDWDIDVWRFGEEEKAESELDRYLKAPLLVLKGQDAK